MTARRALGRLAVVAGIAWIVAEARRPAPAAAPEAPPAPPPVPPPVPSAAAAPAGPAHPLRRRLATSLVYSALFFAGAAVAAGAGNELTTVTASPDGAPPMTATTQSSTTETDATATDATAAEATATDATAAEATTTDATTATDPSPAADATPAATATGTDATPTEAAAPPVDPSDATPAPGATLPAPASPAGAPPAPAPRARRVVRTAPTSPPAPGPAPAASPAPAPATAPFPVLAFDPSTWLVDHPASPVGEAAVAIAEHELGVPYRWGGNTPSTGFDCSGLTQYVYAQLGVWLPHYAAAQFLAYPRVDPSQLQPGDLVFFEPKADGPGHVAIYAGGDRIVEAPHTGAVVRIGSFSADALGLGFLGAVRPRAAGEQLFGLDTAVRYAHVGELTRWIAE